MSGDRRELPPTPAQEPTPSAPPPEEKLPPVAAQQPKPAAPPDDPDAPLLQRLRTKLAPTHPALPGLLDGATLDQTDAAITLRYPTAAATNAAMLERGDRPKLLADALTDLLGKPATLEIAVDETLPPPASDPDDTPAPSATDYDASDDELLQTVLDVLGGTIVKVE
ncbi:MAG: hypothetical protein AAGD32_11295 [Planctomycetota bacterium]